LRALLLLLLLSIAASACRRDRIVEKQTLIWKPVNTWSGSTSIQTESFPGQSGAFQIHWESRPDGSVPPGRLRITLHSAISGRPLSVVVEHEGPGRDTAFTTDDPRMFFLVVNAQGTAWTVKVDEGIQVVTRETVRE
jgi:hypothetical protein